MSTRPGVRRRNLNNCRRKIPYESMPEAKAAARRVRAMIKQMIVYYRCPLTRGRHGQPHWHIGHPEKREFYGKGNGNIWREDYPLR